METDKLIKEYSKKAKKLAIIKSALCGVIFGFALDFILAFILWFVNIGIVAMLLLSIGLGIVGGIAIGILMYFKFFKPTTQTVAKMIDKLGLEERVITMYEMENVDSKIARLQREDAKKKIGGVSPQQFRFQASKAVIILLAVFATLGISMTTVSALSTVGALTPGSELIKPEDHGKDPNEKSEDELVYVEVNYIASENGTISGEAHQRVVKGKDATPVVAVPEEGYIFVQWDDGQMNAERWDWGVTEDITVTAIFQKKAEQEGEGNGEDGKGEGEGEGEKGEGNKGDGDSEDGEGEGEGDGDGEGDGGEGQGGEGEKGQGNAGQGAQGAKGDGGETQSQGGQGQGGKPQGGKGDGEIEGEGGNAQGGDGEKGEGNGKTDQEGGNGSGDGGNQQGQGSEGGHGGQHESNDSPSSKGDGGGAGKGKKDNNTVMDGGTDYKDAIDYEKGKESVENDDSLPPELKDALNNFFDGMKP